MSVRASFIFLLGRDFLQRLKNITHQPLHNGCVLLNTANIVVSIEHAFSPMPCSEKESLLHKIRAISARRDYFYLKPRDYSTFNHYSYITLRGFMIVRYSRAVFLKSEKSKTTSWYIINRYEISRKTLEKDMRFDNWRELFEKSLVFIGLI